MSADPTPEELATQLRERTLEYAEAVKAGGALVKAQRERAEALAILCDHLQTDLNERTRKLDALVKAVLRHRDAVNDDRPEAYAYAREMWALAATPVTTALDAPHTKLANLFCSMYSDTNRASFVLARCGIGAEHINPRQAATTFWRESLDLVDRLGLLPKLTAIILADKSVAAFHKQLQAELDSQQTGIRNTQ